MKTWTVRLMPNLDNGHSGATLIQSREYASFAGADSAAQGISAGGQWWATAITSEQGRSEIVTLVDTGEVAS